MSGPYDLTMRQVERLERRDRWISRGYGLLYLGLMVLAFLGGKLS